jgi:hypothetical protein
VVLVGVAASACCDYGHSDLLFGRSAPEEVFPVVAAWLGRHTAPAPRHAAGLATTPADGEVRA